MQGETLSRTEATEVFFSVTKLWQSKDVLVIKNHSCVLVDSFIHIVGNIAPFGLFGNQGTFHSS